MSEVANLINDANMLLKFLIKGKNPFPPPLPPLGISSLVISDARRGVVIVVMVRMKSYLGFKQHEPICPFLSCTGRKFI